MVSVLGVNFANLTLNEVFLQASSYLHDQQPHVIITAGPEFVMHLKVNEKLQHIVQRADLVTPDGNGIVMASRWYGKPLKERVTGVELTPLLLSYAKDHHLRVYVLGASEEASTLAIASLLRAYPGLMVKGRDGYFTKEQEHAVVADIRAFAPHLLLVGLGQPRQEIFIDRYREALGVPLAIGVGGTIDILAGTVKRSPQFFQRAKLEWLYRLLKEPRRFRRQLVLPVFAWQAYWDARRRSTT